MSTTKDNKVTIKAFLLNKAEHYEDLVKEKGIDGRKDEVKSLIKTISESEGDMYERRKKIQGFDFIMAEGKIPSLLYEAINSYILGNFYATIALCGMTAERLCYDFIDFVDIRIGEKLLNQEEKEILYHLPFNRLVEFFWKIGSLNDNTKNLMYKVSEIRNRHVHPKMSSSSEDSIKILNLLCEVLEEKLSLFQFYEIKNGTFVLKDR